jgi:N-acetylmuramoyl-L-alanine amidase
VNLVVPYKSLSTESVDVPQIVPDNYSSSENNNNSVEKPETRSKRNENAREESPVKQDTTAKNSDFNADNISSSSLPVFKIQIIASDRKLRSGDKALKGLEGCEVFEEGYYHKYTYGASTDYNEIHSLRKQIIDKFPQSFIIAFKDGKKMNVVEAIKEFKSSKAKK